MAFVLADRVKETTTTTGTGTVTLLGASTGYQSFSAIGNGNTTYYVIAGRTTSEWEVGIGTYTSAGTTLSRTTVLSSSNSGSLVNFSAGTKDVFVSYPASKSVNLDASGNVSALGTVASGTWNATTLAVAYGGTGLATATGVLVGAGSSVSAVAAGTSGNVLTSNGTTWVSQAASGGGTPVTTIYTSPATWTKPATLKAVKVTVLSGGGGGGGARSTTGAAGGGGGGAGGYVFLPAPSIPGPQPVASGVGGAGGPVPPATPTFNTTNGSTGGTASFGTFITATGGAGNSSTSGGATGSFTAPAPTGVGWVGRGGGGGGAAPSNSGAGGDSFQYWGFGGSSRAPNPAGAAGLPGTGYGSGGSGGAGPGAVTGGNGANGYVIVEEFY